MTDRLSLPARYRRMVEDLLSKHVPNAEVWAYGSRVNGKSHEGSDLDLVVRGHALEPLGVEFIDLVEALQESDIPILVQAHDWANLPERFHREIERDYVVVRTGAGTPITAVASLGDATGFVTPATPDGWREVALGDCAELVRDSVSPSDMGDALYIGLEHIGEGTLSLLGKGLATDVTSAKARFECGDILFGKLRPYFRKVVRAPADGLCSTDIWVVRAKRGVDQGYLFYSMASQEFIDFATAGSEGTKMPRAIWEYVSKYEFSLPPLPEQRAIAHVLGALDDKIELNRRMNATLEAMARALFKSWFVDFDPVRAKSEGRDTGLPSDLASLFPDRLVDSALGEIPAGWGVGPLGKFFELQLGGVWGKDEPDHKAQESVYCMRGIDCHALSEGKLPDAPLRWLSSDQMKKRKIETGDLLIEGSGSFCGRSLLWRNEYSALFGRQVVYSNFVKRLAPKCLTSQAVVCWRFLQNAFQAGGIQAYRTGTAFPNLDVTALLADLTVVVPSGPIADAFADLGGWGPSVDYMKEARTLAALRDTLLPRLVSGEMRVKKMEKTERATL
ncbi:MAG: restriction endonuclease subunit S [Chloroflexota bacterium]|nr:restriction endonuclease subunit S [Chloroflexota bacterium]